MTAPAPLRVVPSPHLPGGDNPLLDEWEMFGRAAGWTMSTIKSRRGGLEMWQRHTGILLEQMTARDLAYWLSTCRTPATRCTYYRHARSFFTWLKAAGHREDDPTDAVPRPKVPRGTPRPVPTDVLMAVLESPRLQVKTYAYLVLGAFAGLRAHEIAKIRGEDVDVSAGTLWVLGKGGQEATIPLHWRIARVARGFPDRGYWFPQPSRLGHVSSDSVTTTVTNTFTRNGYPNVTCHQLRHWFGTNVLRSSGGNLRVTQECMRHSSPATTAIYTLVEDADRRRAVEGLPG